MNGRQKGSFRKLVADFIVGCFGSDAATRRMISECVGLLADLTHLEIMSQPARLGDDPSEEIASVLVLNDGNLDLSLMYEGGEPQLVPHSRDLFATAKSEFTYDPEAKCSRFDDFMNWFACGDSGLVLLMLQFMAYALLRRLDLQRFVVLTGNGSNGKSVLLRVIQKLVGHANCSALSIERLGGRFNLASLSDKSVNIAADANEITKVAEGNLKMLVDGSEITYERKHQDPYSSVCYTRLIFACNVFPRFRDRSDGIWRRLLVVPCDAQVTGGDVHRCIEDTFDMSAVLNRVLEAGAKLIADGDFSVPRRVVDATNAERNDANPTVQFLNDRIVVEPDGFLAFENLYRHYSDWCENFGYKALAENNFGKEFRKYFNGKIVSGEVRHGKSKTRPRLNGYWGLSNAPNGPDEYFEAKEDRRQREIQEEHKRLEREAKREASRLAATKRIEEQQAKGILQPNKHRVNQRMIDGDDQASKERLDPPLPVDKSIMDEIADALGESESDEGTDHGEASHE